MGRAKPGPEARRAEEEAHGRAGQSWSPIKGPWKRSLYDAQGPGFRTWHPGFSMGRRSGLWASSRRIARIVLGGILACSLLPGLLGLFLLLLRDFALTLFV